MWHCPHCGAPQAETARCWVCRRSSTTCSTCRHFRGSLAADVGWCSLDPKRLPLTGLELRGCWEERIRPAAEAPAEPAAHRLRQGGAVANLTHLESTDAHAANARAFVPVELLGSIAPLEAPPAETPLDQSTVPPPLSPPLPLIAADGEEPWAGRTSLFGDLDR